MRKDPRTAQSSCNHITGSKTLLVKLALSVSVLAVTAACSSTSAQTSSSSATAAVGPTQAVAPSPPLSVAATNNECPIDTAGLAKATGLIWQNGPVQDVPLATTPPITADGCGFSTIDSAMPLRAGFMTVSGAADVQTAKAFLEGQCTNAGGTPTPRTGNQSVCVRGGEADRGKIVTDDRIVFFSISGSDPADAAAAASTTKMVDSILGQID